MEIDYLTQTFNVITMGMALVKLDIRKSCIPISHLDELCYSKTLQKMVPIIIYLEYSVFILIKEKIHLALTDFVGIAIF